MTYSANLRETRFELIFDVPPDFNSLDEAGRQSDEFQYYLDRNGVLPVVEQADSLDILVRGGEIARTGAVIVQTGLSRRRCRRSGRVGAEIGMVPFELTGTTLRFVIPWAMLEEDDGLFSYALMLTRYGAMSDFRSGRSRLP